MEPLVNSVVCNSNLGNRNIFYGTYFVDHKFEATERSIIIQSRPQGISNTYIAVSSFEIYYGNCQPPCATCIGPTALECTSCRGLFTTLSNGVCSNCPPDFYANITCFPCPAACQACSITSGVVVCSACKNLNGVIYSLTPLGQCQSNQFSMSLLTGSTFSISSWSSSAVLTNPVSTCGAYQLLGGLSIGRANSQLTLTVSNLPVHTIVHVIFNALIIDQNPQDSFQYSISVDNITQQVNFNIPAQGTNECGSTQVEYLRA